MWSVIGWVGILVGGYLQEWQKADEEGMSAEERKLRCLPQERLSSSSKRLTPQQVAERKAKELGGGSASTAWAYATLVWIVLSAVLYTLTETSDFWNFPVCILPLSFLWFISVFGCVIVNWIAKK